jgi:hypothetical protein
VKGIGILRKFRVHLDGVTGSLVDILRKVVVLFECPSLLISGLAAVLLGERSSRSPDERRAPWDFSR